MPLKPSQIRDILNAKREDFTAFNRDVLRDLQAYREALLKAMGLPDATLTELLTKRLDDLGARPIEPLSKAVNGVMPFKQTWQSREQSLAWVRDRLTGITTFAVDGSQVYPGKDLSIPIALVQIGWFENLHLPTGDYEKDIALDVMTPADLKSGHSGEPVDRRVNMRRFEMETQRLVQYMKAHPNVEDCLLFLDGSLVATFAEAFDAESRQFYVECLLNLLRASEEYRVPLVAYIDTTYAQDVSVMLRSLFNLPASPSIHDAQLWNRLMEWGDRTPLFLCQRSGILSQYQDHREAIAFTYLKTTSEGYPARLEMPMWMYEAGLVERVIDWVRGEVIVGNGYPYVIETADQTAVLQADDRQAFYRILQEWAETEELNLRFSRKMVSKVRRR
ncbi:DNA double-strand break repair nuclease NurA [Oculatella sp. LEGE 06141]|uniref:DNA double-strand break repair nuclease NurA n=1 Tax=Oculatella sp. LEGE 06141 TaxID=1828648 RepID=UPI0018829C5B|nr:DNA double-strand break repair nuclease NurA [Oculatella sp. LEGE 06141]MBE9177292.1 DNA double-strand break repair nuclease NurA [Oculatella sp. LEGE 06141]